MSLKQTIEKDTKDALKAKDELLLLVLRGISAAFHNKEIDKRTKLSKTEKDIKKLEELSKLTEDELVEVLMKEVKKRKQSIEAFEKGGRNDLVEKEKKELEILKRYFNE